MSDADTTEPAVNFEVDTEPAAPEEDSVVGEKPITDAEDVNEDQGDDAAAETFPRSYVEKLRGENARYRERAKNADAYAKRLHTELGPRHGTFG